MQETAQQYMVRIRGYLGDQDAVKTLSATPSKLRSLLQGVSNEKLKARPAADKWSVMEQAAHLADVEIAVGFRVRLIIGSDDGVPIAPFDQDRWLAASRYNDWDLGPTLDAFTAARENNLRLYRSLNEAQWNKFGIHAERGKETVRDVITLQGGHDLNHLKQIEAILGKGSAAGR